jgi:hypothetical protein
MTTLNCGATEKYTTIILPVFHASVNKNLSALSMLSLERMSVQRKLPAATTPERLVQKVFVNSSKAQDVVTAEQKLLFPL